MKIPTVSRFLWFFDLTTGGLFLGYVGAVVNAGCALALLYEFAADKDEFEEEIFEFVEDVKPIEAIVEVGSGRKPSDSQDLPAWAVAIVAFLWIGMLTACAIISIWFIQGVNNRDPKKVKYFLIIIGLGTLSSFAKGFLSLSFWWILLGMANVYFLICVYSLHELLQYENVEQVKSHASALRGGYEQCYDSEMYHGESGSGDGYQTTEFNKP